MSEIVIQQLIAFPSHAPSSNEFWLTHPQRLYQLTPEEADHLTQILTDSMDDLAAMMADEAGGSISAKFMKEQLLRPFEYAFDKGFEIVYKIRSDSDEPVEFNPGDIEDERGNNLPEHMQLNMGSALPTVAMIFEETIDFADQEATSLLDIEELFKSILTGGMFLGIEFSLRQHLPH